MKRPATLVCRVLGVVFVAVGLVTLVAGEEADRAHNLLHFGTGIVAAYFGFVASMPAARTFCRIFGGGYLAFGILGSLLGWHAGPLHLALGDHVFHIVLGGLVLAAGIVAAAKNPRAPTMVG